ncbi:MAG TPA: carbohydrate ABC transporter permease [Anaerolineales bacterium]|nr:carbohydrate ABC transporter permease [Anaerolineales bacterium]HMZ07622.1 carbohydrate ABC transporter permease [Anaerolineales bacterium]HNA52995.1 carbohydrate ABC transporter permease [Anaerolineales bacterium]HNC91171.1 carbohydrate ABC transporter permease [Anaerolineales bacterium]HNF36672.1 carbohydrate ABC transporter permease [Anaerolineales bacterium]
MKIQSYRFLQFLNKFLVYFVLTFFALVMIFPFLYMLATSFKIPADTFRYPPRMLPRNPVTMEVTGYDEPLPLYYVDVDGVQKQYALAKSNIKVGVYAPVADLTATVERYLTEVKPTGGATNQQKVEVNGKQEKLFDVEVDGQVIPMILVSQTTVGEFIDPQNPENKVFQNVRLSEPVENIGWHPENYVEVVELNNMARALTNTALVTILVVVGQLLTSVVGGYAFARLKFPGRDTVFVFYLGTIMIPFVMLIVPLYQLMVLIGWTDRLAALVIPWIFTAYGTFLMRQHFITFPKEIEEAALLDGASRWQILKEILIPASVPALATQATFTFLYAWNSFFWPLVIINVGNERNHVLTLALNVLRGRASDTPNLILAGAAIAIVPPLIVFIFGQRFFVESVASSGVKG